MGSREWELGVGVGSGEREGERGVDDLFYKEVGRR